MSNNIFEELPSKKGGAAKPMGDAAASIEKKARQLVYDARYEVKKILAGKKADAVAQERMVLERIAKSTAIPAVKARARQMVSKKAAVAEDFIPTIEDAAATSIAKAMFKVFVEGVEEVIPDYLEELAGLDDKKYKIRVTDPKTGNSYVRYGTREKITQLRSKGLKVELTEYGEPREGEKKRGEETARATGGGGRKKSRGLDPVGKEDSDPDNDGQHNDPNDKYIMKRRAAIGKAIASRNESLDPVGREDADVNNNSIKNDKSDKYLLKRRAAIGKAIAKEDYLWTEGTDSTEGKNTRKITGTGVDNYASGVVKISPQDGAELPSGPKNVYAHTEVDGELIVEKAKSKAQQRFMALVYKKKKEGGEASPEVEAAAKGMSKKEAKKYAKTKHKGLPEKIEESGYFPTKESQKEDEKKYNLKGGSSIKHRTAQTQSKVNEEQCSPEDEKKKDSRGDYAKINLIKNKLRAMGAKNPIVMVANENVEKGPILPGEKGKRVYPKGQEPKPTGAKLPIQNAGFEPTGNVISEREFDEPGEPRGTQRQKVDPEAWEKSRKQWEKIHPDIYKPKTPQAKSTKTSQTKTA